MSDILSPIRKANLFAIDAELDQVSQAFDMIEEGGDEAQVKEIVYAYFGEKLEERDAKLDSYASLITVRTALAERRRAEAAVFQAEADRLNALAISDEKTVKRLKDTLRDFFKLKGITKLETTFRKFWIQKNGGKVPVVVDPTVRPESVDKCYQRVTIEIDVDAVRSDLQGGIEVPFARLGEVGSHVRIK